MNPKWEASMLGNVKKGAKFILNNNNYSLPSILLDFLF